MVIMCRGRKAAQSYFNQIIAPCQGPETGSTSESGSQLFHVVGNLIFQGLCTVTVHREITCFGSICSEHGSCHWKDRHMAEDWTEAEKQTHVLGSASSDFPKDGCCRMIKTAVSWGTLKLREKNYWQVKKKNLKKKGEKLPGWKKRLKLFLW